MNADNRKKSSRIKRGKGLRVRIYPTPRQQRLILPMMHARHVIRNWVCDIFNRSAARAAGNEVGANGLAIDCTENAVGAAVRDLRRLPGYKWLQTIPLWSALQVVKDCFKAREQAFELKRPMPKGKRKPPNGEGSVAFPYDGRVSDCLYVPGERIHLSYVGEVEIRTGRGYMPEQLVGCPTLTVSTDAAGWWWLSLGVPAPAWGMQAARRVSGWTTTVAGADVGLKTLVSVSDGTCARSNVSVRTDERRARVARHRRVGRSKRKDQGLSCRSKPTRLIARVRKQAAIGHRYRPGGDIHAKREVRKTELKRKRAVADAKRAEARKMKEAERIADEAKTKTESDANASNCSSKTADSKTTKSRKVRTKHHRGKGSGTKHRARAHTRSQDERTQRRLQREMSRRKPESKRREKTRVQLAKSYAKTTRRRSDTTHKASKWLVDLAAVLRIETLKVIALSRGWAGKGVLRAQLGALLRQLEYKAKWYGTLLVKAPSNYPSSQLCSHCGHQFKELTLSMRTWTCSECASTHERDHNASINLVDWGLSHLVNQGKLNPDDAIRIRQRCVPEGNQGNAYAPNNASKRRWSAHRVAIPLITEMARRNAPRNRNLPHERSLEQRE